MHQRHQSKKIDGCLVFPHLGSSSLHCLLLSPHSHLKAFTGVINANEPTPKPTACRFPISVFCYSIFNKPKMSQWYLDGEDENLTKWWPPWLSGSVSTFHLAAPGSNPKYTSLCLYHFIFELCDYVKSTKIDKIQMWQCTKFRSSTEAVSFLQTKVRKYFRQWRQWRTIREASRPRSL